MEYRLARTEDIADLWQFYREVCAAQAESNFSPGWHFGIYPAAEDVRLHVAAGEIHLCRAKDGVLAAAVLIGRDDPMYAHASWLSEYGGEDAAVIHLFAVHPSSRRQGISDRMLSYLIAFSRRNGKKVLRLDVVTGNLPAERLYQKHGFLFAEERQVYYEDTGEIRVRLFELDLQK